MAISVSKINETFLQIDCESSISQEISDHFSFHIPNYHHLPAFKKSNGKWDGKIRLFSATTNKLYYGLLGELGKFAKENNYNLIIDLEICLLNEYTKTDIDEILNKYKLPSFIETRDYQYNGALSALNYKRIMLEAATASGKSFIAFIICRMIMEIALNEKIVIIVPRTSLVEQMYSDFKDYGMDVNAYCGRLYDQYEYDPDKQILFSTWQSLINQDITFFHQFKLVIGDEAHGFKAASLKYIMENCINAEYRIGMTGTVPELPSEKLLVEGLFGPKYEAATTETLIKQKYLNQIDPINIVMLQYSNVERKQNHKLKYQDEIQFLIEHKGRNEYIKNLAITTDGNTLVAFSRIENHGKPLYNSIKENTNRKVFYISGEVKTNEREKIRKIVNDETNAIIVASIGTFSTGVNIPNLNNLILAMPTKSPITIVQLIGRVLRKSNNTTKVWDIVDDLSYNKKHNYAILHAMERIKIYAKRNFKYVFQEEKLN